MRLWYRDPPHKDEASDQRYEYRIVRYPKDQKKSPADARLAKELAGAYWYGYIPLQDADWRWTSEYRVDAHSPWVELGVHGYSWEAEYECNQHAKKRATPKIKYLGKLP